MIEQSFMKSLFHGVIADNLVVPYPEPLPAETSNLHIMLDSVRRYFAQNVDAQKIDREAVVPDAILQGLKDLGLFGLLVPSDYGGIGLSATAYARVMQEVSGLEGSLAVT